MEQKKQLTEKEEQEVFDAYEEGFEEVARGKISTPARPAAGGGIPEEFIRIRLPNSKNREVIGVVLEDYGQKLLVKCMDGYTRTCRIPGKIRYKVYINPGDFVLIQKWVVQSNEKGDYLYRYTRTQVNHLIKKGFLKESDLQ
ncbi:TPA: translation initiation factor eIF-1A [archaeon]|uniref:Translation initiation factor 1A n=1 Tax=Candidatus Naiadarchaeum limnaeum TaxID=2756139 RepID=A0A832V316_9ARCH|nr:translation initiation factor eIF-1A [Candidatus Naiadarchaeum limnaeum]